MNTWGQRATVQVASALDETIPYDLVLVTLQTQQVDAVLPALRRCSAKRIQFMFNQFDPERLKGAVGAHRSDRCLKMFVGPHSLPVRSLPVQP